MQRTRKWSHVGPEAKRLADLGLSPLEVSEALGVDRSTVQRWMAAGRITDTRATRSSAEAVAGLAGADVPAPQWAAAIRAAYPLDTTDDKLVTLADLALSVAQNLAEPSPIRLAAAGRFQSLVKQLAARIRLPAPEQAAAPVRAATVRTDPRAILIQ